MNYDHLIPEKDILLYSVMRVVCDFCALYEVMSWRFMPLYLVNYENTTEHMPATV
jgi:hypothetical protein